MKFFSTSTMKKRNAVNLVAGWMEPSDMREIKRMAKEMEARTIMFPDMTGVLDTGLTGKYTMYPHGGTTLSDKKATGDSRFTIGRGEYSTTEAWTKSENKSKVKLEVVDIPLGRKATDHFVM